MAMNIFFLLNVLGLVFLLYVLVNFWNEGRRPECGTRKFKSDLDRENKPVVFVATHSISRSAQGGRSIIPFQIRDRDLQGEEHHRDSVGKIQEMPVRRSFAK